MIIDEEKQNSLDNGEEIQISVVEYLRWYKLPLVELTDEFIQQYLYEKRYLWTKKNEIEIIYDIIQKKF